MFKRFRKACILLMSLCMLLGLSVFLVACGESKDPPAAVDAGSLKYDGYIITWSGASNASNYTLTVNGAEYPASGTSLSYPCESFPAEAYDISIVAQNAYGTSAATVKRFTKLPSIAKDSVHFDEEGTMTWSTVGGAMSYEVEVNGAVTSTAVTTHSNFVYGGENNIRIRPVGADGTFALWSETITATYLATPTDIEYDGQSITWQGSGNPASYSVYINGTKYGDSVTSTSMRYDSQHNDFKVEVRAEGNGSTVFPSKKSEAIEYIYLAPVQNVRVENGKLKWDPVAKAAGYTLQIEEEGDKTVTGTEYQLPAGITRTIAIRPFGAAGSHAFSEWSPSESYHVLAAPELDWDPDIKLDGAENRNLTWEASDSNLVSGYRVKLVKTIQGQTTEEYPTTTQSMLTSFLYAYEEVGIYKVSVQALTSAPHTYSSAFSPELTVERLAAPNVAQGGVTSNPQDVDAGFSVRYTGVSGATKYRLHCTETASYQDSAEGATSMTVASVIGPTVVEEQIIHYGLQSIGSVRTVGNSKYVTLDSLTSVNTPITITVLAMPTGLDIPNGTKATWTGSVHAANGYYVEIESREHVSTAEFELSTITAVGTHNVKVCAAGDGEKTLPSRYTNALKVTKLAAPTNIRVETDTDNGRLSWDEVAHARSFEFWFNGEAQSIVSTDAVSVNDHISVNTVDVMIRAIANEWDEEKTEYFLSSGISERVRFTKLMVPTDLSFTSSELLWKAPGNAADAVDITYRVYGGDGRPYSFLIDGTRMSTLALAGGQQHVFQVRAIGDGERFINSDLSDPKKVEKLLTPTVNISEDRKSYTWTNVAGAQNYQVYVDSVLKQTDFTVGMGGKYTYTPDFTTANKQYKIQVIAIGDNGNSSIDSSPWEKLQMVQKIGSFTVDRPEYDPETQEMTIKVKNPPAHATAYQYYVNNILEGRDTSATEYRYTCPTANKYRASVVAVGRIFDTDHDETYYINSDAIAADGDIEILGAPSDSSLFQDQDGRLNWGSTGSKQYEIVIYYNKTQTEPILVGSGACMYDPALSRIDPNSVTGFKVRSKGNGTSTFDSKWVEYLLG